MPGRPLLVRRARNKKEKVSSHDPGPGIYKRFDSSGKLRQPHPCEVSLPSVRLDQDGKERKQNFKLCNIETAGGKCFSEGAAGPIGMLGEFVHSQLSGKGAMDYRTKNRCLHRLNDWLKFGRPEDLRACPKPVQTAVLDWVRCLPSLQLGRNIAEDSWSRAAVASLLGDFPKPLRPIPSKIQSLVDQAARLLDCPEAAPESSEDSGVSQMDIEKSARWQEDSPATPCTSCGPQASLDKTATPAASVNQDPALSSGPGQTHYDDTRTLKPFGQGDLEQVTSRQRSACSPLSPAAAESPTLNRHHTSRHHMESHHDTPFNAGSAAASDVEDDLVFAHGRWDSALWEPSAHSQLLLHEALPWQPNHTWHGCTFL
ncbi:hypothetical protein WJX74_010610 [Apatococcus lobatus]|uniref:Uncharacterized protein n=1 Tax=Apatococcus lobatus TaxID=904363 RepID=A0AAW1QBA9_9CHLO